MNLLNETCSVEICPFDRYPNSSHAVPTLSLLLIPPSTRILLCRTISTSNVSRELIDYPSNRSFPPPWSRECRYCRIEWVITMNLRSWERIKQSRISICSRYHCWSWTGGSDMLETWDTCRYRSYSSPSIHYCQYPEDNSLFSRLICHLGRRLGEEDIRPHGIKNVRLLERNRPGENAALKSSLTTMMCSSREQRPGIFWIGSLVM